MLQTPTHALPWLDAPSGQCVQFPPVAQAWAQGDPMPGLLAGGGNLEPQSLRAAYAQGIFPWFSQGQPSLWWSPDPRMTLHVSNFKLHPSLRKTLAKFIRNHDCEIRIDHDFAGVIAQCAQTPRAGQGGTWIVHDMQAAYTALHHAGAAHSVETWIDGVLAGGLYCTALGAAVFGESMFSHQADASKIALAALVALCRAQGVGLIDCQQNTAHLASLGAQEMPRSAFCAHVAQAVQASPLHWRFEPIYWQHLHSF